MTSPAWELAFLKALERCGVASEAAASAGTGVRNAFKRRKGNPTFAAAWDSAVALYRAELGRRAMEELSEQGLSFRQVDGGARVEAAGQPREPRADFPRKSASSRWTKRSEEAFLVELSATGSVKMAARAAGFTPAGAHKRRHRDRHFDQAWDAALEAGKARVQAYLVEAATRTFDPDELPDPDDAAMPKVTIGEAISIAKLPPKEGRSSKGTGPSGWRPGGDGRIYDETGFDTTPITRDEWEEAQQRIIDRLARLRDREEKEERETGRCRSCGQLLQAG